MQTSAEYNQAYQAGYDKARNEMMAEDFHDVFSDVITKPKDVPLKDSDGKLIGRINIDPHSGLIQGTIRDTYTAIMLQGQLGAGLKGISFESIRYNETPNEEKSDA